MQRPTFFVSVTPVAAAGWLTAETGETARLWAFIIAVAWLRAFVNIVNDILDREGDRATAAYLPLPAGLISVREALGASVLALAVAVTALWLASADVAHFIVALVLVALGLMLSAAYSPLKRFGIVASLVAAAPFALTPFMGWYLAGARHGQRVAIVALYAICSYLCTNTLSGLRDVDRDAIAGNRTLAVRIGSLSAFRFATICSVVCSAITVLLAEVSNAAWWCIPLGALSGVATLAIARSISSNVSKAGRGRVQRLADVSRFQQVHRLRHILLVATLSPMVAAVLALIIPTLSALQNLGYDRRIIGGRLRQSAGQ